MNMSGPSFSGGRGGGGGQDRARGHHLTAASMLSAFGRFSQWGGVCFRPIQPVGRGAVRFQLIQPVEGGGDGGGGVLSAFG